MVPLLAAHGDDAEVRIGGSGLRIDRQNLAEGRVGSSQVSGLQGLLAASEGSGGIRTGIRSGRGWVLELARYRGCRAKSKDCDQTGKSLKQWRIPHRE